MCTVSKQEPNDFLLCGWVYVSDHKTTKSVNTRYKVAASCID